VILGRVAGRVVQTVQHPAAAGRRLLVVDRLDPDGRPAGGYVIAVDAVGAGHGETVLVLDEGNGARQVLGLAGAPLRAVVVGVVDDAPA
jgi:microcompartment protein CcmK/EutM